MQQKTALVVFSHLRWNFVFQRPQHLLSRLSATRRVIFIEEPVHDSSGAPRWELHRLEPNVLVCRPHTAVSTPGFSDDQMPVLQSLVRQLLVDENLQEYVLWF